MRLPLDTRGSIGETWMETCANGPPKPKWNADSYRGATRFLQPLYPHVGYCVSTPAKQTGRGGCGGDGDRGGRWWWWWWGCEAPISPDASLADRLLLLGKITPLVVRSPRWLYYLHGRAFIWLWERQRGTR